MCEHSYFSKESVESLTSRNYQMYPLYDTKSVCGNQKKMRSEFHPLPSDAEKWLVDEDIHCCLGTTL